MLIQVSGKGFELTHDLRQDVEEKVGIALERFSSRVRRVNVFLEDVNGPKKGLDKLLRLIVDIDRQPLIIVEEKGEVWNSLVDQTLDRATQTVSRQIDRIRSQSDRTSMSGDGDADSIPSSDQETQWNPLQKRRL